ncbi:FkbM family methyltransferase [Methylobacterium sp. GC_Met_2]|uniref:FkbM family methyltransferase n=1 Tax=Methylobacterium sp. GC_Met_2 TaxID=2937376 RepID=UPI00226B4BC0|nr:FkbM family methyltransferase [Methylobacterium sp. GC_Met_2]
MKWVVGKDHFLKVDRNINRIRLGSNYGGWFICPDVLSSKLKVNVISIGIGRDITFDLALIEMFGATVHAFDPTPLSIEWVNSQALPKGLYTHQIGIAAAEGEIEFGLPLKDGWDSYSAFNKSRGSVRCPVTTLNGILEIAGSREIDIFKMDIEGSEFEVIDEMSFNDFRPGQILVEFHYNSDAVSKTHIDTISRVEKLRNIGYSVFDVSPWGREFSLIRNDLVN